MLSFNLNDLLEKNGKSQYWLSKETNLSYATCNNICKGKSVSISLETLEKICKVLKCTPNDILTSDDVEMQNLLSNHSK
jgi:putative transcriptional regulator